MTADSPVPSHSQKRPLASYILAASIFSLSGALVYFTWTLSSISVQIPAILTSAEHTSSKIEPVLQQASDIKDLIPPILEEVRETRKLVKPVLEEVRLVREQIPPIIQTTEKVVTESQAIRPLIPETINEVKLTREAIPPALDRADALVANLRKAGKEASQGAVTGIFTGIIAAPFELIGNIGKRMFSLSDEQIKELTEKDLEMAKQALVALLPSEQLNKTNTWNNPETKVSGSVSLIKIDTIDDKPCKQFHVKIRKTKQALVDKNTTICLNDDDEWEQRN